MEVSGQLHVPANLSPEEIFLYRWIRGWVGFRAGLEVVAKRKIPDPVGNTTPVVQPIAF
jgi:hypothetical protein